MLSSRNETFSIVRIVEFPWAGKCKSDGDLMVDWINLQIFQISVQSHI